MDAQFKEAGLHYMATSARSMLDRLAGGQDELFVSGSDLRQALEVAAAVHLSAEAEEAGTRDNTEALVYRISAISKNSNEANKTMWAIKKKFDEKKEGDG